MKKDELEELAEEMSRKRMREVEREMLERKMVSMPTSFTKTEYPNATTTTTVTPEEMGIQNKKSTSQIAQRIQEGAHIRPEGETVTREALQEQMRGNIENLKSVLDDLGVDADRIPEDWFARVFEVYPPKQILEVAASIANQSIQTGKDTFEGGDAASWFQFLVSLAGMVGIYNKLLGERLDEHEADDLPEVENPRVTISPAPNSMAWHVSFEIPAHVVHYGNQKVKRHVESRIGEARNELLRKIDNIDFNESEDE